MSADFAPVWYHRLKYLLSPQLDLYRHVAQKICRDRSKYNAQFHRPLRILDYGCGTGVGTLQLLTEPSDHVLGLDADPEAIRFAKDTFGGLIRFEAEDWLVGKSTSVLRFDVICCVEVIEHVSDPAELLRKFKFALSDQGTIVVSTLNHNSDYRKNDAHVGRYTVESFYELLRPTLPGATLYDYTLTECLDRISGRTPMVAVWRR